jgi:hypothetical protein
MLLPVRTGTTPLAAYKLLLLILCRRHAKAHKLRGR